MLFENCFGSVYDGASIPGEMNGVFRLVGILAYTPETYVTLLEIEIAF